MVIVNPSPSTVSEFREEQRRQVTINSQLQGMRDLPARTRDDIDIQLYANIDNPDELDDALEYGAMGVGLFRTEFLFMGRDDLPDEEAHYTAAVAMLQKLGGATATIRTFDLGADKLAAFLEAAELEEANPALGLRSIRLCLAELGRRCFRAQLRGLLRGLCPRAAQDHVPMISGIAELRAVKVVVDEVKAELTASSIAFDQAVKLGIMIEMPSAAITADLLAQECDFFSIGTNDLIQYTMAVDRVNEYVSYLYEPLHPSLLRLIGTIARAANSAGIPVTICGEMAGEPMIAPVLIGLGIRELSMSAVSVPEVKQTIRSMALGDAEALVKADRKAGDRAEVRAMVSEFVFGLVGQRKGRA